MGHSQEEQDMNTTQERIKRLFEILDEVALYRRTLGKLGFDRQCCAPKAGMEQAGEDAARLSQVVFRLTHSEEYFSLIEELYRDKEALEPLQKKLVEYLYEDYEKTKNISPELSLEIDLAFEEAFTAWLEAKEQKDYSIFKPSFAKLIAYTRQMIDLRGEKKGSYYDVCLDDYEKGGSIAQLDGFFNALKERILPLIRRIKENGKPIRDDFLTRPCAIAKQEAFSHELLAMEGLRTDALVLMTSEHPFTDNYGPNDVRVTTHYYEENFISNIFSTLHEGGHALFMQNEPKAFHDGFVSDRMTSAMHECMSRFYENIIGRSEAFIHAVYPKMQSICGDTFTDVTERELYEAVNIATPGLSRM
jgi:carboxypeptidase Taq